jgi:hypothetical protein
MSSTSLLFLYRVRAVFSKSKIVAVFFAILWVALLGLGILAPLALEGDVSSSTFIIISNAHCFFHFSLGALI